MARIAKSYGETEADDAKCTMTEEKIKKMLQKLSAGRLHGTPESVRDGGWGLTIAIYENVIPGLDRQDLSRAVKRFFSRPTQTTPTHTYMIDRIEIIIRIDEQTSTVPRWATYNGGEAIYGQFVRVEALSVGSVGHRGIRCAWHF